MRTGGCVHVYACLCVLQWQRIFFFFWCDKSLRQPNNPSASQCRDSCPSCSTFIFWDVMQLFKKTLVISVDCDDLLQWWEKGQRKLINLFIWIFVLYLVFMGKFCIRNKKLTSKKWFSSQKAYWLFSKLIWKKTFDVEPSVEWEEDRKVDRVLTCSNVNG